MVDEFERHFHVDNKTQQSLVSGIRAFFRKAGKKRAVVGLSGGIDSAVVCALLAEALGPENVFAYHFPFWKNPEDERHARQVAKRLSVNFQTRSIKSLVDSFVSASGARDDVAKGNFMSRSRMALLYHFARENGALVAGTGNRTEFLMGYFTKFGDGAADYFPIAHLYKEQVRKLAVLLALPREIIDKPPSAGLWAGQTDEGEMGLPYAEMDRILVAFADLKWSRARLEKRFGKRNVDNVVGRVRALEHKRKPPGMPARKTRF